MMVCFWGAQVMESKSVHVQPPEGFVLNVQLATLDATMGDRYVLKVSTRSIDGEPIRTIVCSLRPKTVENVKLDLVFGWEAPVTFEVSGGSGTVHLSGYYQPGPGIDADEMMESDNLSQIVPDIMKKSKATPKPRLEKAESEDPVQSKAVITWDQKVRFASSTRLLRCF